MHSQLIFSLIADSAFPPNSSLINQLSDCSAHPLHAFDPPRLVDLQEILSAAAGVTLFKSVLDKVRHNFDLME